MAEAKQTDRLRLPRRKQGASAAAGLLAENQYLQDMATVYCDTSQPMALRLKARRTVGRLLGGF